MIFLLDNFDSFTYNIVQYLAMLGENVVVRRNTETDVAGVLALSPGAIVLSPGPGRPENAGIMPELLRAAAGSIPILGVCLGHQAIGQFYGAKVIHARQIMHGKTSPVAHDGKGLFQRIPQNFQAVRYHSLALDPATIPDCLEVTARTEDGEIMGVRHREYLIEGVQYHPESVLTTTGKRQLANFLTLVREARK